MKGPAATELLSSNLDHGHQHYVALILYSRGNCQIYLQYFEAVFQRIRDARLNPGRFEPVSALAR